jgi:hypothetical protein
MYGYLEEEVVTMEVRLNKANEIKAGIDDLKRKSRYTNSWRVTSLRPKSASRSCSPNEDWICRQIDSLLF